MARKKPGPKDASDERAPESERSEPMNSSATPELSTERIEALRRWIDTGGHNAPEVAEVVARRLLARGDLRWTRRDDRAEPRGDFGPLIH